jgi:hypothetical protein
VFVLAAGGTGAALAAGGKPLSGGAIKALLAGHTAQLATKNHGDKSLDYTLRFGADGSFSHHCIATFNSVRGYGAPACPQPRAKGHWAVAGNRLCIETGGKRRCFFVARADRGEDVLRPVTGGASEYGGRFTVAH